METSRPVWPVFVTFVLAFGIVVAGSVAVYAVAVAYLMATTSGVGAGELAQRATQMPAMLVGSLLVSVTVLLGTALAAPVAERVPIRERLRLEGTGRDLALGLLAAGLVMGVGQVMDSFAHALGLLRGSSLELISGVIEQAAVPWLVVIVILGSVGPGVAEELYFRGYAQTRLVERWGTWPGIVVASTLFGLVHADLIHTPMAFLIGLVLGWVAVRTGSIRPGIVGHAVNNAGSFLLLRLAPPSEMGVATHLALAVVGAAVACVAGAGFWWLTRPRFSSAPERP